MSDFQIWFLLGLGLSIALLVSLCGPSWKLGPLNAILADTFDLLDPARPWS
ncbi:hypothetical protein C8J57DRAFT_1511562 [Mycena rebaudengoi]|nr:hypothetical protein C8J57DRAFT_1511562 [Mycena rebaudengoi]